jgi:hypothetical protein
VVRRQARRWVRAFARERSRAVHPNAVTIAADGADRVGNGSEALYAGYNGTGYLAGWGHDGQSVDISINVPATGPYDLLFRYAAIGDALRCIRLNGAVLTAQQRFPNLHSNAFLIRASGRTGVRSASTTSS